MVEALVVIAVIGTLAAVGLTFFGNYHRDVMLMVRNQRNAQEICALTMGATAAGATIVEPSDMMGTILTLIEGRDGSVGPFKGRRFRLSQLTQEEIEGAMKYLEWRDGLPSYRPDEP